MELLLKCWDILPLRGMVPHLTAVTTTEAAVTTTEAAVTTTEAVATTSGVK
jgi:hypothetical protein